jgi:ribonuclease-3
MLPEKLGYSFKDPALLEMALTHPSAVSSRKASSFERLEFLGDRVLGLVIAELLYQYYPNEKEGDLAKRLSALVCGDACHTIAKQLDLINHVKAGAGDLAAKSAILADAMEALIGAIYMDSGLDAIKQIIKRFWMPLLEQSIMPPKDPKTTLQEWAQGKGKPIPNYTLIEHKGPDHSPVFTIEVFIKGIDKGIGVGSSKRQAEQAAAKSILEKIGLWN